MGQILELTCTVMESFILPNFMLQQYLHLFLIFYGIYLLNRTVQMEMKNSGTSKLKDQKVIIV